MPHTKEWLEHLDRRMSRLGMRLRASVTAIDARKRPRELCTAELRLIEEELEAATDRMRALTRLLDQSKTRSGRPSLATETRILREELQAAQEKLDCLIPARDGKWIYLDELDGADKEDERLIWAVMEKARYVAYGRLPVHDFPPDILRLIFEHSVHEDDHMKWYLSHVCQSWRDIALSTPCLWSLIRISHRSHPEPIRHQRLQSGAYPLFIDIDARTQRSDEFLAATVEELRQCDPWRWARLDLSVSLEVPTITLLQRLTSRIEGDSMALLDALAYRGHNRYVSSDNSPIVASSLRALLSAASRLRVVDLAEIVLDKSLSAALPQSVQRVQLHSTLR